MTWAIAFWVVYIIMLFFGGYITWSPADWKPFGNFGGIMILVGILGWGVYGPIVH